MRMGEITMSRSGGKKAISKGSLKSESGGLAAFGTTRKWGRYYWWWCW